MKRGRHLTTKEARGLANLLGEYQTLLESIIESHTLSDGSIPPNDPTAPEIVREARRDWRRAENWVAQLTGEKPSTIPARSDADTGATANANDLKS